jgi:hypothetical protein
MNFSDSNSNALTFIKRNLSCANFSNKILSGYRFYYSDLRYSDLSGSRLDGACLYGVDLREANLSGADLAQANLSRTRLEEANLSGANLKNTVLDPRAKPSDIPDERIVRAGLEINGGFVLGWRTQVSTHVGMTRYEPGAIYVAPIFSICQETECHPGIYLSGRRWLENHDYYALVRVACLRKELVNVGDKWRAKRILVLPEEES